MQIHETTTVKLLDRDVCCDIWRSKSLCSESYVGTWMEYKWYDGNVIGVIFEFEGVGAIYFYTEYRYKMK